MKRSSSWIADIKYHRGMSRPGGFLAIFLAHDRNEEPVALLYGNIPSYIPGLLVAGTGKRSIGYAYNKLVKSNPAYTYQRVEGAANVEELRRMMAS